MAMVGQGGLQPHSAALDLIDRSPLVLFTPGHRKAPDAAVIEVFTSG